MTDFPPPPLEPNCLHERRLPDGRRVAVLRMLYNDRVVVHDPASWSYDAGWCFPKDGTAIVAVEQWDGTGEPAGWMKNLQTGEFRAPA